MNSDLSPTQIRSDMIDELRRDLVGPRNGPDETIRTIPHSVYLTGILFPIRTPIDSDDDQQEDVSINGDEDAGNTLFYTTNMNNKQSSMGLTCTVSNNIKTIDASVKYGTYEHIKGSENQKYKRTDHSESFRISLDTDKHIQLKANPKFILEYTVKREGNNIVLSVYLINSCRYKRRSSITDHIFQPKLTLTSKPGTFVTMSKVSKDSHNSHLFDMLFRDVGNFAEGHGCATQWEMNSTCRIWTEFIPQYESPTVQPREMKEDGLDMKKLYSVQDISEYQVLLEPIAKQYEDWVDNTLVANLPDIPDWCQSTAQEQIKKCRNTLRRIREGIQLVSTNHTSGKAFEFTNRVMLLQRSWGEWARSNARSSVKGNEPPKYEASWRPFQIAFILLNIQSIINRQSEERDIVDLLWFPTGSGKTEAYLGLVAFTMAYRRLSHDADNDVMRYGTVAIMRYTLRLLTIQQFHRAATLMCACEHIRKKRTAELGDEPFLVGLWVGNKTTPNKLTDAKQAIIDAQNKSAPVEQNPIQFKNCPWCGAPITAHNYVVDTESKTSNNSEVSQIKQCRIYCSRSRCEFSKGRSSLPVLVVDEDIYKRCPSLIIGTVDKFAQISWNPKTASIFGKADKFCEKDGFVITSLKDCGEHRTANSFTFSEYGMPKTLEPPDLIIQDELHLISGPLGTLVGAYETAIDILCTNTQGVGPKIIASTATARSAQNHIKNLFNRKSDIFPPPGFDFGESFFAQVASTSKHPGKIYVGVCPTQRSGLQTLGRISACILYNMHTLKENSKQNNIAQFRTLTSYFNSLRELGGASKMYDDTVVPLMRRIEKNDGKPKLHKMQTLSTTQLTSRVRSDEIPAILQNLESDNPYNVLLCTNMLSVGVDIPQLGVMVVNGQPKNHAEYIQATGRIGRQVPGLVVTLYNHLKPRDLSHYENFYYYHSTLHRNVESVSLTPFSARARDRALFGILVALARLLSPNMSKDARAIVNAPADDIINQVRDQILHRVKSVDPHETNAAREDFDQLIKKWREFASEYTDMTYTKPYLKDNNKPYLLGSVESAPDGLMIIPNSLRDAEQPLPLGYKRG